MEPFSFKAIRCYFGSNQCDQIGRFIGLWATLQSLWQQLICPHLPHSTAIFVKVSKSLIFLVKSFLGNFWRFFSGHTGSNKSLRNLMHKIDWLEGQGKQLCLIENSCADLSSEV